jgi:hygromycin-B 4-O-kinase
MIPRDQIESLLTEQLGTPITNIEPIDSGQISEPYFFSAGAKDYVVRFAQPGHSDTLFKDRFVSTCLLSPDIPAPEFVAMGELGDRTWAITRRAPGKILDAYTGDKYEQLIPSIVRTLDRIHQTDISSTTGSGGFSANGAGRWDSWSEFLGSIIKEEGEEGFYGKWHHLFDDSFLDHDLFQSVYHEMESLLQYCPAERFLVHADYAFDNVLAENGKVTAVLDWANSCFGDFLYDVAWMEIGMDTWCYADRFRQLYQEQGRKIAHFEERMRCYYCHVALDSFKFYAKTNQPVSYNWIKSRIELLLD